MCAPVLLFGMESSWTFCPPNLPAKSPKTRSLGQQPSSGHHRGVNKSLKAKVPSSSCKQSIYRPQVRGCAADNQISSRPSNSSDKSPRRKVGNADTFRVGVCKTVTQQLWSPRPQTLPLHHCVTLGVLPDLSVLNDVIHEMEMTTSLHFIKASMSKYL